MDAEDAETEYDFGGKYKEAGRIGGALINAFYGNVNRLVTDLDYSTALEVGCGEGHSTQRLVPMLREGASFRALDVEQRLVDTARSNNPGAQIDLGSIYELDHPDGSFDLVFCMEVLEHLEDPARALRELARVSRRWLLLTVPREPLWRMLNMARLKYVSELGNTPGHLQHWSRRGFVRFAKSVGRPIAVRSPIPWTQVLLEVE